MPAERFDDLNELLRQIQNQGKGVPDMEKRGVCEGEGEEPRPEDKINQSIKAAQDMPARQHASAGVDPASRMSDAAAERLDRWRKSK